MGQVRGDRAGIRPRAPGRAHRPGGPARPGAGWRGGHHRRHHLVHRRSGPGPGVTARAGDVYQRPDGSHGRVAGAQLMADGVVTTDQRDGVRRLRIDADPESVEKGLVTLVLTLVELL